MAGKQRRGPTREQFTDEQWEAFGRFCECMIRMKAKIRAKLAETKP